MNRVQGTTSSAWRKHLVSATATVAVAGGSLVGFTGVANAAPQTPSQPQVSMSTTATADSAAKAASGWTFYRAYWTKSACVKEGLAGERKHWWKDSDCKYKRGLDGRMKWFLYVYDRVAG
ncbi:hypothetical protein [Streptomyces sp. NRRL B-1347]|uniref:hypothetical protein n=1 Tax=Streptomyces sp. NRRL B-1347 TaxID=1476877 RepID=UPI00131DEEBA|nr:hypothetical protein [Streptomyces sp. NRRL B-1347]